MISLLEHACLLNLLESFHTPLVPFEWYDAVVRAGKGKHDGTKLINALPSVNANVIRYITGFLEYMQANREVIEKFAKVIIRVPKGGRKNQDLAERCCFLENIVKRVEEVGPKAAFDVAPPTSPIRKKGKEGVGADTDDREARRKRRSKSLSGKEVPFIKY